MEASESTGGMHVMNTMQAMGAGWKLLAAALAAVVLTAGGCDDDRYDHKPPQGMGTLYVENETGDRVRVYLDGEEQDSVGSWKRRHYDLKPGTWRLALDGSRVARTWVGDVDVLEGRRTVAEVRTRSENVYAFDVRYFFD